MRRNRGRLRAGVIGGGMGRNHMQGYATHPKCELVAICDVNADRAKSLAETFGVEHVFRDYRRLLAMDDLDIVSVAVPNYLHGKMTIAALNAGKDVLCEKPMATKLADAEAMVRAATRAKKRLMINMSYRFHPVQQRMAEIIAGGDLGGIYYAKSHYMRRKGIPLGANAWFISKRQAGGGPSVDLGVHAFDLVWWLMGSPRPTWVLGSTYAELLPVRAAQLGVQGDVDDLATAMVRFDGGRTIFFEASWDGHVPGYEGYEIFGTKGGATCRDWESDLKATIHYDDRKGASVDKPVKAGRRRSSAYWHFVDCCLDRRRKMIASGEECTHVARVLDAMNRSQTTGKAVEL